MVSFAARGHGLHVPFQHDRIATTALGVLAPILRDRGELDSAFGTYTVAAAAAGEFGPLMIISLLLIPAHGTFLHGLFMVTFIIAFIAANLALNARSIRLIEMMKRTMQSSGQLPVRICILLQILFVALAAEFGLNIVMGAFAAGMVSVLLFPVLAVKLRGNFSLP